MVNNLARGSIHSIDVILVFILQNEKNRYKKIFWLEFFKNSVVIYFFLQEFLGGLLTWSGRLLSLKAAVTSPDSGSQISLTIVTPPGISNFSNLCFLPCVWSSRRTAYVRSLSEHWVSKSKLVLSSFSANSRNCCKQ